VSAILAQLGFLTWGTSHNFKVPTGEPDVGTIFMGLSWRPQQLNVSGALRDLCTIDCGR
jgi:hypothetical protein